MDGPWLASAADIEISLPLEVATSTLGSSALSSVSIDRWAQAALGELAVVSGIGELLVPAPVTARCCGMEDGGDGEEVPSVACSDR